MCTKSLFLSKALNEIPKILTLLDRNPHSRTFGCFDRNFWHYKIIDFPSGMSQEFVWPLALAYDTSAPENSYYKKEVLRDWIFAGMKYAADSSHKDGSCDDYYPFERASGAAAFSLLAFIEAYKLLKFENPGLIDFFSKRADWLADHMESGQLSNHQALIALSLQLMGNLTNTNRWDSAIERRISTVLSWQSTEGWFQEYEGCDPGYHTLTLMCLAWLHRMSPKYSELRSPLEKAIDLAFEFVHPDGTYGGEYGSRSTNNFFSYGFELAGQWYPKALYINDQYMRAILEDKTPCCSDDHILGHHTWNDFLTYRDFVVQRVYQPFEKKKRVWLKNAGILIDRSGETELFTALNKGGVFKLFHKGRLVCADTNFSIQVKQMGEVKTAVAHLVDKYEIKVEDNLITISGYLGWAKQKQMNTTNMLILRLVMVTIGRFYPNLVRKALQFMLITGKKKTGFTFKRCFERDNLGWRIKDSLRTKSWKKVRNVGIGCDQTSIYVVMSRTFHQGNLFPFIDLTPQLAELGSKDHLIYERVLP